MPTYAVHHVTTYRYRQPVGFGEHRMMFLPREGHDQHLLEASLTITPEPSSLYWSNDALGNRVGVARFATRADTLVFDSAIRVAHQPSHPAGFRVDDNAATLPATFGDDELSDLAPYLERRYADPDTILESWAETFLRDGRPTLDIVTAMAREIRERFTYVRRTEKGIQDPATTLAYQAGTCRDFTELMIEALRVLGLPARFVSGYLYVPERDRHDIHGGGATHAWVEVYLSGAGWIDVCPTNAIIGNHGLIRIAIAREPSDALPLSGSYRGFRSDELGMEVLVKVLREDHMNEDGAMEPRAGLKA